MNLNSVMPANTHIAPISTDPISAVHITRSVSTADLVSTVSHAGQNASGNVLATPIASESLYVTAATTTAATKEDSPMQSSKASSKTGNRKRARATSEQVTVLESVFMVNRSPASRVREDLAARLGMAPRQVQVWFQNRRAKEKTQQRNPRGLQHHPSILLDQLAYTNGPQDFYSMAMATTIGGGPGGFPGNSAVLGYSPSGSAAAGPSAIHQQPGSLADSHGPFSAAAGPASSGTWLGWSFDMMQQGHPQSNLSRCLPAGMVPQTTFPQNANISNVQLVGGDSPYDGISHLSSDILQASALKSMPETMHIDYGAASSTGATTALTLLHAANIADSRRESEASGITAVASPGGPGSATLAFGSASATASNIASPTATPISGSAAAVIKASVLADQNGSHRSQGPFDSRYTSSASLVPPVSPTASPIRPAPKLSHGSTSTSTSSENIQRDHGSDFVCSPNTTAPVSANNGTLGSRCDAAGRRPAPLTLVRQQNTAGPNGLASGGNGRPLQGDMGFGGINTGMAMALSGRLALGYSPFIPEIPSYMLLDATRLSVGSWIRVPMDDTELTCHACVAPPPLKPVMRPGNHRPAELDSLIGEFQWIISSAGQRYKMVLSYSAISRIKFRELPDTAASLVDVSSDSVSNPQAALSLLSCALKNPQAKGELSIHIYDLPTYYLQTANGSWKEIGDFSENLSASNTGVHTISGSFATLFYKLRILLATCSRLKIAADPLMSLWLGNMDDPYSAFSAIPHNAWTPCAEAVCLHSAKRSNHQAPDHEGSGNDKACLTPGMFSGVTTGDLPPALSTSGILPVFGAGMPMSAVSSTIGTLTPTPTSAGCFQVNLPFLNAPMPPALGSARSSAFAFQDPTQAAYTNTVAAAIATGASGIGSLPLKTQRSASLPFIRSGTSNGGGTNTKANPSSSLCRSIESDGLLPVDADSPDVLEQQPTNSDGNGSDSLAAGSGCDSSVGLGISNTPPPLPTAIPLRHRASCNHLRRPAPYQIALPAASPRVNSPQMSPSSFWHAHNLRRTSRDSLSNYFNGQSATGHTGQTSVSQASLPNAVPGRRESDTELALAMNSVFANGNVLGAHRRGMSDFYGVSAILPSPLSNVTMTAAEAVASASSISSDTNVDLGVLDSANLNNVAYGINTSTQQSSRTEIQSSSAQEAGSDAPTVSSFASSASVSLLTPADFGGSFAKHAYATGEEGTSINPGIIDPNMFMTLVNAMNDASASQIINSADNTVSAGTMRYSASADQLNPATSPFDSNSLLTAQTDIARN
ncbi:hypothetical protein H4217_008518, partial [Coemansia sp. RSA 1939]